MNERKVLAENAIERLNAQVATGSPLAEKQKEHGSLLFAALKGDRKAGRVLQEAISTSDVPLFLTPAINALFLAEWANTAPVWNQFTEQFVTDRYKNIEFDGLSFSTDELMGSQDGEVYTGYGLPRVGELEEYPAMNFNTENVDGEIAKHGLRVRMSWETSLRTGSFAWVPRAVSQMAQLAAEQEDLWVAKVLVTGAGAPNAAFGRAPLNPVLSYEAIEDAILQSQSVRVNGRRTNSRQFQLVTGYGLSTTARNILNTTEVRETTGSTEFIINPSLGGFGYTPFDALDQFGGAAAANSWFLIPTGTVRPAIISLRHEDAPVPQVFVKSPNALALGGGLIDPMNGSFEVDDTEAKCRVVGGAAAISPTIIVASSGSGVA